MRVRDLQRSHKIAVGDDGDRIYMIDAKDSQLFVYSFNQKSKLRNIDLQGAPEEFLYPTYGDYYYVSVLQHLTIYQISKRTDEVVAGYVYSDIDPRYPFRKAYLRNMDLDVSGRYLYGTCSERNAVAIWDIGNPEYSIVPNQFNTVPDDKPFPRLSEIPHYVPVTRFRTRATYRYDNYIPQPKLIATDPLDEYVYVVDEYGALYIYDRREVFVRQPRSMSEPADIPVYEVDKERLVKDLANDTAEVRDIAVSRAAVRGRIAGSEDTP